MKNMNFRTNRKFRRLKESNYGWTIKSDSVLDALEAAEEALGTEGLLDNLVNAMSTDELKENLEFICRMNDIEGDFLEDFDEDEERFNF